MHASGAQEGGVGGAETAQSWWGAGRGVFGRSSEEVQYVSPYRSASLGSNRLLCPDVSYWLE